MHEDPNEPGEGAGGAPPARVRLIGHAICRIALRAPAAWPLLRPFVGRFFDARAPGWDERTGAGGPEHLGALATAVVHVEASPERVLDIGCGTGAGTLFLARELPEARVRGIDISEAMIRRARRKVGLDPEGRIAFRAADASKLPFDDASFDLVTQINMPVFAAEARRVMRPGGFLVVASSQGAATPFHTPIGLLSAHLRRLGVEEVATGEAGPGLYYVGRLPGAAGAEYASAR